MAFFDQIYDRLFAHRPKGIILFERISRSEDYKSRYLSWKKSYKSRDLLEEISVGYAAKLAGIASALDVHILMDKYSQGFAVSYTDKIGRESFQFIFDLLAEKAKNQDYKLANSDWTVTEREGFTETVEKHYLKPVTGSETPIDLQFGNIQIEHILINDQPSYIRLIANSYNDRNYLPPKPFNDLLNQLFN